MTANTTPGQAGASPGPPAEPGPAQPGLPDRVARYGVWGAVITHILLRDRRFHVSVITGAIGSYALGSVFKSNQARPLRRATAWYNLRGQIHDIEERHHEQPALKPGER
jgi:hypothetical protein